MGVRRREDARAGSKLYGIGPGGPASFVPVSLALAAVALVAVQCQSRRGVKAFAARR
jgi:hypothetical protein